MQSPSRLNLYQLHYDLGHILHEQGDLVGAARSYQQAIEIQADSWVAHLNLGVVLDAQGHQTQAAQHYRQAIALRPDYVKAYNNLGCTLAKLRQWNEAIQVYEQALKIQPDWAVLHDNLAQVLANQGNIAAAIATYQRAIQLQPDLAQAHYHLGKVLQSQGQHRAAIDCFQRAMQLEPGDATIQTDLSVCWMAEGKFDYALPYLRSALQAQAHLVQPYCEWTEQLATQLATQLTDQPGEPNQPDAVTQARITCGRFLHQLQKNPHAPELLALLAQTYFHWANALMTYGGTEQYQQAQIYYQQVLQLQPTHLEAYLNLGYCLTQQGRSNAAILLYHLALAAHPHQTILHRELGQTLEHQQNFAAAITHYKLALTGLSSGNTTSGNTTSNTIREPQRAFQPMPLTAASTPPQQIYPSTQAWVTAHADRATYLSLSSPSVPSAPILPSSCPPSTAPAPASCQGLNCASCLDRIFRQFDVTHVGKGIHTCTSANPVLVPPLPRFVATLPDAKLWATSQHNDWLICNAIGVITSDNGLLAEVSRFYPGELPGCSQPDAARHRLLSLSGLTTPEHIQGTVAALAGLSGHNYYHWMVDVLPRLALLQQAGFDFAAIDRFWINYNGSPFQQATLTQLGIPLEKVISSDRHPHLQVDRLVLPSFAGHLGWLKADSLQFLRQHLLPLAEQATIASKPERIYISRAAANHRRVLNEAAVIEHLQSIGFVSVQLERLSLADQIALFTHAKVIIAPHGGGLTNLLFCQPHTTVIELVTPHYIRHYFWVISNLLGLSHYFAVGEAFSCYPLRQIMYPSPLTEDIWVTIDHLTARLQQLDIS